MTGKEFEQLQDAPLPRTTNQPAYNARFFPCPKCGTNASTPTCRQTKVGYLRHKECPKCGYYFYTLDNGNGEVFFHDRLKKAKHHKMHRAFQSICKAFSERMDNPPPDTIETLNRVVVACGLWAGNPEKWFSK